MIAMNLEVSIVPIEKQRVRIWHKLFAKFFEGSGIICEVFEGSGIPELKNRVMDYDVIKPS